MSLSCYATVPGKIADVKMRGSGSCESSWAIVFAVSILSRLCRTDRFFTRCHIPWITWGKPYI